MKDFKSKMAEKKTLPPEAQAPVAEPNAPVTGAVDAPKPPPQAAVNVEVLLVSLYEDLQKFKKVVQGMSMYQHAIFRKSVGMIQTMEARLLIAQPVVGHISQKLADADRIAGMPSVACENCGLVVSYNGVADAYPDTCPACGVPHEGDGKYSVDPATAARIAKEEEDNADLPIKYANDLSPASGGGLPE